MNLNIEEQRATPRVAVQFHALVSGSVESEGTGLLLNLSRSGCRLESQLLMLPGLSLELRIAIPGSEWALMIDGADVQWADEDRAGLAFVRIRETEQQRLDDIMTTWLARTPDAGTPEHNGLVPFEFQGLEATFSQDPVLAVRKGLAWFTQDRVEFPFRGRSLLNRAFPACTSEFAGALGALVKNGTTTESEFSLAVLQNYVGSPTIDRILKEIVARCSLDDPTLSAVRATINRTGTVSGELGLANAWHARRESLRPWLTDDRPAVTAFADQHMAELDRMILAERRRVETERELRERTRHEDESGHDHGYRPKPF